jgi:hypothetical protein
MLMKSKALTISLLLTAFWVLPALGQWEIGGIRVADVFNAVQWFPHMIQEGEGGVIICWQDSRNGTWDIYAQRVDSSGYLLWGEDGVPVADGPATQDWPVMASDGQGGAIIAWEQPAASDIYAQRIDSEGQKLWGEEGIVVCTAPDYQGWLDITEDGQGGAIMAWEDERTAENGADIYAQRVDGFGNALWRENGFPACSLETNQFYPHLISDGDGGAIIGWEDGRDWAKIYVQKVDAAGNPLWSDNGVPNCVDCITGFLDDDFAVTTDLKGGVILVWADYTDNHLLADLYAGRLDSLGNLAWDQRGVPVFPGAIRSRDPRIATDSLSGVVIAGTAARDSVCVQRLNNQGDRYWGENGLPVSVPGGSVKSLDLISPSQYAVTFSRALTRSSYGAKFDTTGAILWDSSGVPFAGPDQGSDSYITVGDGAGGLVITWDSFYDGYVYAQRIYPNGKVGGDTTTTVEDYAEIPRPMRFELLQSFPNPFNSTTTISFYVPVDHPDFILKILNIAGRAVRRFDLGQLQKGTNRITWDGKDDKGMPVSSGIYFYSITDGCNTKARRMILLK